MKHHRYEFDLENFRFRKVTRSLAGVLKKVVLFLVATVSLSIFYYVIFAFVISTDTEKELKKENRMYAKMYPEMVKKEKVISDALVDLKGRDNAIYAQLFHTEAPSVDPSVLSDFIFSDDSIPDKDIVEYTASRLEGIDNAISKVDSNFLSVFAILAKSEAVIPPMDLPVPDVTYTQTGASVGMKMNPFYKVVTQHDGLDIIAGQGDPVYAAAAGTVKDVIRSGKGLGNVVEIDHKNGYVTRYAHLANICVSRGQSVEKGKKIGEVGVSGNTFAPHLHYEVRKDTVAVNPVNYMFASLSPEDYMNMMYMSASSKQSLD